MKCIYQYCLLNVLLLTSPMVCASHMLPECIRNLNYKYKKRCLNKRAAELDWNIDAESNFFGAIWDFQSSYFDDLVKEREAVANQLRALEENYKKTGEII